TAASGLMARTRSATLTPSRRAVCIGTEMATKRALATRSGSKGSTAMSSTSGAKPARRRKPSGRAAANGWGPSPEHETKRIAPGSRRLMVAPSRSFGRHLAYHPEAGPAVGVAGHEPEPVGGAAAARLVQPAAAPDHQEEIVAEVGRHHPLVGAFGVF